jgi:F0F1-type ATP synthase assembly protein I
LAKNDDGNPGRGFMYGIEVAVGFWLGYVVGTWCDRRFGSNPWGLLIGMLLGGAAGMYPLFRESIRANKD